MIKRTVYILSAVLIGAGFLYFLTMTNSVGNTVVVDDRSNFELGQYYFNHDDDPSGPYDLTKARFHYEKTIAENPESNELVWYQLGRIDFLEGKFDSALEKFATQIRIHGDSVPNVYYMIALTHGYKARREGVEESWIAAEENFLKFIEYSPYTAWPRVDLAWVYFSQGKFAEMKPVLAVGLNNHPENPWLLNMYGLAVMNTEEDKQLARPYFEQAKTAASSLTVDEWGRTYPGNSPDDWPIGLDEFKSLIDANLALLD